MKSTKVLLDLPEKFRVESYEIEKKKPRTYWIYNPVVPSPASEKRGTHAGTGEENPGADEAVRKGIKADG